MNSDLSTFKVIPKVFNKKVLVPSSKSYGNRLLILAGLSKEDVTIKNIPPSSDVEKMLDCFSKIGLTIINGDNEVTIKGSFPECELKRDLTLKTGDGGTTNRFILPFLGRGKQVYTLEPEGHMRDRPMGPLVDSLREIGVTVINSSDEAWLKVQGPIRDSDSEILVDSSKSTQFLTGMALALADTDWNVLGSNLSVSLPYWKLTQNLIHQFKNKTLNYINPVDFSSLTYPLALAVTEGEVAVTNCRERDLFQADSAFIEVLKEMGATIEFTNNGLHCKKSNLSAIDFDGSQCPDAIPTLLYVCSFAGGVSKIFNLEVLTHKECDRFKEMVKMLSAFGIDIEWCDKEYWIEIKGQSFKGIHDVYRPPEDHRMVMVAYLFLRSLGGGELSNFHHVKKSFSNFFELME